MNTSHALRPASTSDKTLHLHSILQKKFRALLHPEMKFRCKGLSIGHLNLAQIARRPIDSLILTLLHPSLTSTCMNKKYYISLQVVKYL